MKKLQTMPGTDSVKNLKIYEHTHRELKLLAVKIGRPLQEVAEEALRRGMREITQREPGESTKPDGRRGRNRSH